MGDYVEAMHGEDGHTRDARGRVRFNKTQGKRARGGEDDYDDDDAERDVPVTAGLKELEVSGGGKRKKQKKEVQRVGQEFKAKVCSRSLPVLLFSSPLADLLVLCLHLTARRR